MTDPTPGGRRVARPAAVQICPECRGALASSYPACSSCREALDAYWSADWQALLNQEGIAAGSAEEADLARRVFEEHHLYTWTILDTAFTLLTCSQCQAELGANYPTCAECGWAFGLSLQAEVGASDNEHALHVGRWVLRFPGAHSAHAVQAWRLSLPRVLTGWLPTTAEAQRTMNLIKQGQLKEVQRAVKELDRRINERKG